MAETIKIGGEFESTATGNVVAAASAIKDKVKNKYQGEINAEIDASLANRYTKAETYTKVEVDGIINTEKERAEGEEAGIKERLSTVEQLADISLDGGEAQIATNADFVNPDSTKRAKIPTVGAVTDAVMTKVGYFTCDTAAATAAKTVSATGYVLTNGGSMKIKMTNANTADNATLNINSTGAKALYYAGERASANNSWEAGETIEVYYDPTYNSNAGAFFANNVAGGSGSGDGVYDISAKNSGATYDNLAAALGTNGANVPASKRKGGMSVKFIQNIYATYSVVKTEGLDTEPTGTELQSASDVTNGVYTAAQLSDLNTAATLPATVGNSVTYYFAVSTIETVDEEEITTTTYTKWVVTKATDDSIEYVQWRYMGTSVANIDFVEVGSWQKASNLFLSGESVTSLMIEKIPATLGDDSLKIPTEDVVDEKLLDLNLENRYKPHLIVSIKGSNSVCSTRKEVVDLFGHLVVGKKYHWYSTKPVYLVFYNRGSGSTTVYIPNSNHFETNYDFIWPLLNENIDACMAYQQNTSISNFDFTFTISEYIEGKISAIENKLLFMPTVKVDSDSQNNSLNFTDVNGNVVLQINEGHIKTKHFDSRERFNIEGNKLYIQ